MEKVTGIGGIFFRAKDPKMMAAWYAKHLRVEHYAPYGELGWRPKGGTTVFYPFNDDSDEFTGGVPNQAFMLNFRVTNLKAMVLQLQTAGVKVNLEPKPQPNGWFAQFKDPEGNLVELWQPNGIDLEKQEQ
ncbi:VOC family protein [Maritalea sp.]|uniref:VOC family protein n=1 Tax=Maritalea sp. TaxID=2003361 RepID=UPI003EF77B15